MAKKYHKKWPRKQKYLVGFLVFLVLISLCVICWLAVKQSKAETASSVEVPTTMGTMDIEIPCGAWVGVPNFGDRVSKMDLPKGSVYLEERYKGDRPYFLYGVLEIPADAEGEEDALNSENMKQVLCEDLQNVFDRYIKGGVFSPGISYMAMDYKEHKVLDMEGDFSIMVATEKKHYYYPDGVELNPETGDPMGNKPDGTPWTKQDATVEIEAQPTSANMKAHLCAFKHGDTIAVVWAAWSAAMTDFDDSTMNTLVTQAVFKQYEQEG